MKRVFYISNAYDGSYFVLTDNLEEYFQRLSAYAMNLHTSQKTNHYSIGSVEMSESEYLQKREESYAFEQERIQLKQEKEQINIYDDETLVEELTEQLSGREDSLPDNVIPLF
jgi:hypothetical protein